MNATLLFIPVQKASWIPCIKLEEVKMAAPQSESNEILAVAHLAISLPSLISDRSCVGMVGTQKRVFMYICTSSHKPAAIQNHLLGG